MVQKLWHKTQQRKKRKFVYSYKITKKWEWKYLRFAAFEAITFEPIKIQTHLASQNDRLSLSFVKDKHTHGKKMARKGPTTVVYQYLSFPIRV